MFLVALPIDALLSEILASLSANPNLVLSAEPGAGKTTRVPRALLDNGLLEKGECWILEPRRLAARLAAARVAEELGEELGKRVGYAVRFEQKVSKATRIRFVTEALLLRRLQADPTLKGISTVILDEFHERHLHTDLALTLTRRLQKTLRPDLRILVMSATLEAESLCSFLDAPHLKCEGRAFPVEIRHRLRPDSRSLPEQVAEAVDSLYREGLKGHTLVFLPGAAEIRACEKASVKLAERHGLSVLPLHGSLSFDAQKAAVAPSNFPKLLLSTNVAESSVTIEGISAVVDSGLGREAMHSPWSGLTSLRTTKISRARCIQRSGRAGRTASGICLRLFSEAEFQARTAFDLPEIQRSDLSESVLLLNALGINDPTNLPWFEEPSRQAVESACHLLDRLGAFDHSGGLSPLGTRMVALPLHPRLARLVIAGEDLGIPDLAKLAAVLLETGDLSVKTSLSKKTEMSSSFDPDFLHRVDQFREAEASHFNPSAIRAVGLDPSAVLQANRAYQALAGRTHVVENQAAHQEEVLRLALLMAFPDRVAQSGGEKTYALSSGGGARLTPGSSVRSAPLILALEADCVTGGSGGEVLIRTTSTLEPEWLLDAFPDHIYEQTELVFHPGTGKVERRAKLWYDELCLEESRRPARPGEEGVAACLAAALKDRGLGEAGQGLDRLLDRSVFLSRLRPDLAIPAREALLNHLLETACAEATCLKDVETTNWTAIVKEVIGTEGSRLLDSWAPETVSLTKRRVPVNYGAEKPWIESRLQDFLGMKDGPRIAGGSVPLVLHLLAPNHRAVQVTTDLKGFWERAYQELRPQLSRRYPKHQWPENPLEKAN
jgi:ATP-dependent helicase HrpB